MTTFYLAWACVKTVALGGVDLELWRLRVYFVLGWVSISVSPQRTGRLRPPLLIRQYTATYRLSQP